MHFYALAELWGDLVPNQIHKSPLAGTEQDRRPWVPRKPGIDRHVGVAGEIRTRGILKTDSRYARAGRYRRYAEAHGLSSCQPQHAEVDGTGGEDLGKHRERRHER